MKKLTLSEAEVLASKFRSENGLSPAAPISTKTLLRKLNITAMYRPLSDNSFGISCRSKSGKMFILVNSKSTRGRQHFTIAHELYHLYYDENPSPHMCRGVASGEEKNANMFASALLLPKEGILPLISRNEIISHKVELATILRIEQMFEVSRLNLLLRLKDLGLINERQLQNIQSLSVKDTAREYGYDLSLYESGNDGVFIGDFGEKARTLFESGQISESHYFELLNMISYGSKKN
ncbi:MAG: ImmA/IrrE family metallo-endopeptidase [Rikenellaceae bacterium]|nr:ImmA/IrrE family metallo-endopeptidase [Rikenellaceae bacterium]